MRRSWAVSNRKRRVTLWVLPCQDGMLIGKQLVTWILENPPIPYLILSVPFVLGAVVLTVGAPNDEELAVRERVASGTVVTHEPQNHTIENARYTSEKCTDSSATIAESGHAPPPLLCAALVY